MMKEEREGDLMNYKLNNGYEIPAIGFGTWQTPDGELAEKSVLEALKAGYRHIDTAAAYGNEASVGRALKKSGIPREEIFLTTKLWNTEHGYDKTRAAILISMEKLGVEYLDLYLIHWPNPIHFRDNWEESNAGSWKAMEEAVERGLIRSIGVSNFHPRHLEALFKTADITPAANQIYLSPSDQQEELVAYNNKHGILSQAYSPLGTGTILDNEDLKEIAKKYNKSIAQIAIRWSLQKGFNPLPKSVTPSRIKENFNVFDFEISDKDMKFIDGLKGIGQESKNPDRVEF